MPRTNRNPDARLPIIQAAWRLVAADGVHGATMRRIAAEAGVTTGFVTHYYDDKHELLADVLRHNNRRAGERVTAAIGTSRGLVALESAVEAMLPIDADARREWQVGVAAWGPTAPGEQAAEELRSGWRTLERLLATLLEQAVSDGELPASIDAPYEAARFVALIAGAGMLAGVETPARIRRDAKRMLVDQIASLEGTPVEEIKR
jgi:AcrR family transcriptional regulator